MRIIIKMIIITIIIQSCKSQKRNDFSLSGVYVKKEQSDRIEIKEDGSYILYNSKNNRGLVLDECEVLSKGRWSRISTDIIDLTSENYYMKQNGFKYEIEKEKRGSTDSIYINIKLTKDFETSIPTPYFNILINYKTAKQIETNNTKIALSKKEYFLFGKKNQISLDLVFNTSGKILYYNRLRYSILEDYILDVESYNYFTITLPYFDQCFYEFEPYYHSNIFIKDKNVLIWQGREWVKR
ncbi:hypothetical protein JSO59_002455 [Riemerella anatipestifer]|uniref:hypothetical protein n=1 Tax=Riemerella anatipestifer TaxID=34085 RepID=UPI0030BABA51